MGVAGEDKSVRILTYKKVDVFDANGKKIGEAEDGSEAWVKLEKRRIEANEKIEKERAKAGRPVFVNPNGINYGPDGYIITSSGGGAITTSGGEGGKNTRF